MEYKILFAGLIVGALILVGMFYYFNQDTKFIQVGEGNIYLKPSEKDLHHLIDKNIKGANIVVLDKYEFENINIEKEDLS